MVVTGDDCQGCTHTHTHIAKVPRGHSHPRRIPAMGSTTFAISESKESHGAAPHAIQPSRGARNAAAERLQVCCRRSAVAGAFRHTDSSQNGRAMIIAGQRHPALLAPAITWPMPSTLSHSSLPGSTTPLVHLASRLPPSIAQPCIIHCPSKKEGGRDTILKPRVAEDQSVGLGDSCPFAVRLESQLYSPSARCKIIGRDCTSTRRVAPTTTGRRRR